MARAAIEEPYLKIVLQCLDLQRHRGLGKEQMFRGFAKVQVFGNRPEDPEASIFELRHGSHYR